MIVAVDEELLAELRALLSTKASLRELGASEAQGVVEEVGRRFVSQTDRVWWWESLKTESEVLAYEDSDGLELHTELIPDTDTVRLVVTDDEPGPWPVFEGEARAFWELLRDLRFFEYFVVSMDCRWIVFDTHHNTLVTTGAILPKARSLDRSQ